MGATVAVTFPDTVQVAEFEKGYKAVYNGDPLKASPLKDAREAAPVRPCSWNFPLRTLPYASLENTLIQSPGLQKIAL